MRFELLPIALVADSSAVLVPTDKEVPSGNDSDAGKARRFALQCLKKLLEIRVSTDVTWDDYTRFHNEKDKLDGQNNYRSRNKARDWLVEKGYIERDGSLVRFIKDLT